MCCALNEKWKKTKRRRNRTAISRKNENSWRKEKLQVLGDTENGHHQINVDERKKIKKESLKNKRNQFLRQKSHQSYKNLSRTSCKIFGTILEMDKGRTQMNGSEDKKVGDDAQGLTYE